MAFIIGTAGHIDHGKTSLVRALTGVDLDSAPEEKERGITISLGFTSMTIEDIEYSFVDVPGHERLIRTMIAGATGLHAVVLCVSATDSVMPQTIEHLNILHLLGVQSGLIAITMCDLADEEDIELITEEIEELVEGTFLEGAPIVQTSTHGDGFGLDAIRSELSKLSKEENTLSNNSPFRLPVDRVFTQKGFGTVVTGTARGSGIINGQSVHILPEDIEAKIRNIQQHGKTVDSATDGRIALNLTGVSVEDLSRGSVIVTPNSIPSAQIIDVSYTHLTDVTPLETGTRVRLLFGSSEALGKVYKIDGDTNAFDEGDKGLLQIRLDHPHILCKTDRCIVRRESPLETLGGGIVLDPYAPKIRNRNREEQNNWLNEVLSGNTTALLERMGRQGRSVLECKLLSIEDRIQLGDQAYAPSIIVDFQSILIDAVRAWHETHPLQLGATRMELAPALPFLDKDGLQMLCARTVSENNLNMQQGKLQLPTFTVSLSDAEETELRNRLNHLKSSGLEGVALADFKDMPKPLLQYALETARIFRVSNQLLHPSFINDLLILLRRHFQDHTTLSTAEFKEMTQLSRKFSIPLLEWLDENHKTRRSGDVRISGGMLSEDV